MKRIDAIFKDLGKRAEMKSHGLFRWLIGRKLFLRTCAELGVNQWNAKIMYGKSVSKDIETYINGVQMKNDFLKVSNVLRLRPAKEKAIGNLEVMVEVMSKALAKALIKLAREEIYEGLETEEACEIFQQIDENDFEFMEDEEDW